MTAGDNTGSHVSATGFLLVSPVTASTTTTGFHTGPITCGSSMCDGAAQFCLHKYINGMAGSDTYTCTALPGPCATMQTCDCVMSHTMAGSCVSLDFTACVDGAVKLCQMGP